MSEAATWSYRPGSWFAVVGSATTLLLPAAEKARVGELWGRIDDGEGFDVILDGLLQTGLGSLSDFVLVGGGDGAPTRVLLRGSAARATVTAGDETVELDGSQAATWVERTVDGVTRLTITVDDDPGEGDLPTLGGLARVARVDRPPYAPEPDVEPEPAPASAALAIDGDDDHAEPEVSESGLDAPAEPYPVAEGVILDEDDEPPSTADLPLDQQIDQQPDDQTDQLEEPELLDQPGQPEQPAAPAPFDWHEETTTGPEQPGEPQPADDWASPAPPPAPDWPAPPPPPSTPPSPVWGPDDEAPTAAPTVFGSQEPPPPEAAAPPPPASDWQGAPPPPPPPGTDHDGMTRAGVAGDEFARQQPGIPGQPMAPSVTDPVAKLIISSGEVIEVDRVILIGRAPEARRFTATDQPRLVTVPSPLHEISSTHVEVRPGSGADHGSAVVTDMGSTNGTVLDQPGIGAEELKPGIAVQLIPGAVINLGDGVTIQVTHP